MLRMTSETPPAMRGAVLSILVLAAVAFAGLVPQAHAKGAPGASVSVSSIDFGDTPVDGASVAKSIAFRNQGSKPMSIASIVPVGGNFDLVHDCPLGADSLAPGSYCTIDVRFAPAAEGGQSGIVQVNDAASSVSMDIAVKGNGVKSPAKVLASEMIVGFPDTVIYTTSGPLQVVFTNNESTYVYPSYLYYQSESEGNEFSGYPPLISGYAPAPGAVLPKAGSMTVRSGAKVAMVACADYLYPLYYNEGMLGPGESCVAYIYFTPDFLGLRTGELQFSYYDYLDNFVTAIVDLVGTGVPENFPEVSVSTGSLDFGGVVINTSAIRTVSVASTGLGPLTVFGVRTFGGIFAATTDCGSSVPAGSTCTVTVTCSPRSLSTVNGDLYVDHDASGGFSYVSLACTGVPVPVPKIEVTATSVGFGNQTLGSTSLPQQVLIKSIGSAPLAVGAIAASSQFSATSDCPVSLAPGLSCHANVTFTPSAPGRQRGVLGIASNDPDRSAVTVDLSGGGCRPFSVQAARRGQNLCGP